MDQDTKNLRDAFALTAMQAIIRKAHYATLSADTHESIALSTALGAYSYADAMLKVRSGK